MNRLDNLATVCLQYLFRTSATISFPVCHRCWLQHACSSSCPAPLGKRTIAMGVSVWPHAYLTNHCPIVTYNFLRMLPMAVDTCVLGISGFDNDVMFCPYSTVRKRREYGVYSKWLTRVSTEPGAEFGVYDWPVVGQRQSTVSLLYLWLWRTGRVCICVGQWRIQELVVVRWSLLPPYTKSTQPCIPPGSLNRVPASAGVRAGISPLSGGR